MKTYYNENDPKAAAWLRELMRLGHIPQGVVDERSISDVQPGDLAGFRQCHFFAGIGGWAYALRLAGWPADEPCWTGSCPCQPFSCAGKGKGTDDERHLWPEWFRLIRECRSAIIFGEQVASKDALGWLDGVFADLEGKDYACGASDLCAAGVGSPHIRQRLFWVSDRARERWNGAAIRAESAGGGQPAVNGITRGLSDVQQPGLEGHGQQSRTTTITGESEPGATRQAPGSTRRRDEPSGPPNTESRRFGVNGSTQGQSGHPDEHESLGGILQSDSTGRDAGEPSTAAAGHGRPIEPAGGISGPQHTALPEEERFRPFQEHILGSSDVWSDFDILPFRDGKFRRVEAGTFPLAHGIPGRVGLLRGYGNAIVPQVAAEFIRAYAQSRGINLNPAGERVMA